MCPRCSVVHPQRPTPACRARRCCKPTLAVPAKPQGLFQTESAGKHPKGAQGSLQAAPRLPVNIDNRCSTDSYILRAVGVQRT